MGRKNNTIDIALNLKQKEAISALGDLSEKILALRKLAEDNGIAEAFADQLNDMAKSLERLEKKNKNIGQNVGKDFGKNSDLEEFKKETEKNFSALNIRVDELDTKFHELSKTMNETDSSKFVNAINDARDAMEKSIETSKDMIQNLHDAWAEISKNPVGQIASDKEIKDLERTKNTYIKILDSLYEGSEKIKKEQKDIINAKATKNNIKEVINQLNIFKSEYDDAKKEMDSLINEQKAGKEIHNYEQRLLSLQKNVIESGKAYKDFYDMLNSNQRLSVKDRKYGNTTGTYETIGKNINIILKNIEKDVSYRVNTINEKLNNIGYVVNLSENTEKALQKRNKDIYLPIKLSDEDGKKLLKKAIIAVNNVNNGLKTHPLEVDFALRSKYKNKRTSEILAQLENEIDKVEDEVKKSKLKGLYDNLQKGLGKDIDLMFKTNMGETEGKVLKSIKNIRDELNRQKFEMTVYPVFPETKTARTKIQKSLDELFDNLVVKVKHVETDFTNVKGDSLSTINREEYYQIKAYQESIKGLYTTFRDTIKRLYTNNANNIINAINDVKTSFESFNTSKFTQDIQSIGIAVYNLTQAIKSLNEVTDEETLTKSFAKNLAEINNALKGTNKEYSKQVIDAYKEYRKSGGVKSLEELNKELSTEKAKAIKASKVFKDIEKEDIPNGSISKTESDFEHLKKIMENPIDLRINTENASKELFGISNQLDDLIKDLAKEHVINIKANLVGFDNIDEIITNVNNITESKSSKSNVNTKSSPKYSETNFFTKKNNDLMRNQLFVYENADKYFKHSEKLVNKLSTGLGGKRLQDLYSLLQNRILDSAYKYINSLGTDKSLYNESNKGSIYWQFERYLKDTLADETDNIIKELQLGKGSTLGDKHNYTKDINKARDLVLQAIRRNIVDIFNETEQQVIKETKAQSKSKNVNREINNGITNLEKERQINLDIKDASDKIKTLNEQLDNLSKNRDINININQIAQNIKETTNAASKNIGDILAEIMEADELVQGVHDKLDSDTKRVEHAIFFNKNTGAHSNPFYYGSDKGVYSSPIKKDINKKKYNVFMHTHPSDSLIPSVNSATEGDYISFINHYINGIEEEIILSKEKALIFNSKKFYSQNKDKIGIGENGGYSKEFAENFYKNVTEIRKEYIKKYFQSDDLFESLKKNLDNIENKFSETPKFNTSNFTNDYNDFIQRALYETTDNYIEHLKEKIINTPTGNLSTATKILDELKGETFKHFVAQFKKYTPNLFKEIKSNESLQKDLNDYLIKRIRDVTNDLFSVSRDKYKIAELSRKAFLEGAKKTGLTIDTDENGNVLTDNYFEILDKEELRKRYGTSVQQALDDVETSVNVEPKIENPQVFIDTISKQLEGYTVKVNVEPVIENPQAFIDSVNKQLINSNSKVETTEKTRKQLDKIEQQEKEIQNIGEQEITLKVNTKSAHTSLNNIKVKLDELTKEQKLIKILGNINFYALDQSLKLLDDRLHDRIINIKTKIDDSEISDSKVSNKIKKDVSKIDYVNNSLTKGRKIKSQKGMAQLLQSAIDEINNSSAFKGRSKDADLKENYFKAILGKYSDYQKLGGTRGLDSFAGISKETIAYYQEFLKTVKEVKKEQSKPVDTSSSTKGVQDESKSMDNLEDTAKKAAKEKEEFAEANKDVLKSIIDSLKGLSDEGEAFKALNNIINKISNEDKMTSVVANLGSIIEMLNQPISDQGLMSAFREISNSGVDLNAMAEVLKATRKQQQNAKEALKDSSLNEQEKQQKELEKARKEAERYARELDRLLQSSRSYYSLQQAMYKDSYWKSNAVEIDRVNKKLNEMKQHAKELDAILGASNNPLNDAISDFEMMRDASYGSDVAKFISTMDEAIEAAKDTRFNQNTDFMNKYSFISEVEAYDEKLRKTEEDLAVLKRMLTEHIPGDGWTGDEISKISELQGEIKNTTDGLHSAANVLATVTQIDKLMAKVQTDMQNTRMPRSLMKEYKEFYNLLDSLRKPSDDSADAIKRFVSEASKLDIKKLADGFNNLHKTLLDTNKLGKNLFERIGASALSKTASYLAQFVSLYDVIRYVREGVETVKSLDSAMTELRKVSDASNDRMQQSFKKSAETAKELSATITDVINSTSDWARLGYNVDQAEELARVTTLFEAVGDNMTAESASEAMTSTLKAYNIAVDDSERIVDQYNEVANNFAINTEGLADAITRAGAALHAAGNDLSESMGMVVAANDALQDPSSVGQMLKTMSMRLRGASAADLEKLGIDTEGMTQGKKSIVQQYKAMAGIDIMEGTNYKTPFQILDELHEKWVDLTDAERAALTEVTGGKRGGSVMSSLMENWEDAKNAAETAKNSFGSASKEYDAYSESVEAHYKQLQASLQEFAHTLIEKDVLKNIIDFLSEVVELLTNIPPILTVISSAGIIGLINRLGNGGFAGLKDDIGILSNFFLNLGKSSDSIKEVTKNVNNLEESFHDLDLDDFLDDEEKLIMSSPKAAKGVSTLGTAMKGLLISATITAAISGLIFVISKLATAQSDATRRISEATNDFKQSESNIEEHKKRIVELQEKLSDDSLSYEESRTAREELLKIQSDLIDNYGTEADKINLITKAIKGEIGALDELSKKEWEKAKHEANNTTVFEDVSGFISGEGSGLERINSAYSNPYDFFTRTTFLGSQNGKPQVEKEIFDQAGILESDDIETVIKKLDDYSKKLEDVNGKATTASKNIAKWSAKISEFYNQTNPTRELELKYDIIPEDKKLQKSIDELNSLYDEYNEAKVDNDEHAAELSKKAYIKAFNETKEYLKKESSDPDLFRYIDNLHPELTVESNEDNLAEALKKQVSWTSKEKKEVESTAKKATDDVNTYFETLEPIKPKVEVDPDVVFDKTLLYSKLQNLSSGGNVDLTSRTKIPTSKLSDVGWEDVGEGYATTFTNTYSNEDGTLAINVTPILPNGDVMTPDELQEYAEGILAGTNEDYLQLQIGYIFNGKDAIQQASDAAEEAHEVQEQYYAENPVKAEADLDFSDKPAEVEVEVSNSGTLLDEIKSIVEQSGFTTQDDFLTIAGNENSDKHEYYQKIRDLLDKNGFDETVISMERFLELYGEAIGLISDDTKMATEKLDLALSKFKTGGVHGVDSSDPAKQSKGYKELLNISKDLNNEQKFTFAEVIKNAKTADEAIQLWKEHLKELNEELEKTSNITDSWESIDRDLNLDFSKNDDGTYSNSEYETMKQQWMEVNNQGSMSDEEYTKKAEAATEATVRFDTAVSDLSSSFTNYKSIIEKADSAQGKALKKSAQYSSTIKKLAADLSGLSGAAISTDIADKFLDSKENAEQLQKALEGDDTALKAIGTTLRTMAGQDVDLSEALELEPSFVTDGFDAEFDSFYSWLEQHRDLGEVGAKAGLYSQGFYKAINQLLADGKIAASDLDKLFSGLGWEVEWEPGFTTIDSGSTGYFDGAKHEWVKSSIAVPTPKARIKSINDTGNTHNFSIPSSGGSGGSGGGGGGGGGSKSDPNNTPFDWIERKIKVITDKISQLQGIVSDTWEGWTKRINKLNSAMTKTRRLIEVNKKASKDYKKAADRIANGNYAETIGGKVKKNPKWKGKLDKKWIKKVQNGDISKNDLQIIVDKGEKSLADQIQAYMDYWDKYKSSIEATTEAQRQLHEEIQQQFDLMESRYSSKSEMLSSELSIKTTKYDYLGLKGVRSEAEIDAYWDEEDRIGKAEKKIRQKRLNSEKKELKKADEQRLQEIKSEKKLNAKEKAKIEEEVQKEMDKKYGKKNRNTKKYQKAEKKETKKQIKAAEKKKQEKLINEWNESEARQTMVTSVNNAEQAFEEATNDAFERQISRLKDHVENATKIFENTNLIPQFALDLSDAYASLIESEGKLLNDKFYDIQKENYQAQLKSNSTLMKQLKEYLDKAFKDGLTLDNDDVREVYNQYLDLQKQDIEIQTNLQTIENNRLELEKQKYQLVQDRLSALNKETDFYRSLLSTEHELFDLDTKDHIGTGELNEYGKATAATYVLDYEIYKNQYEEALARKKALDASTIDKNSTTYIQNLSEINDELRQTQLNMENAKKSYQDLIKNQYQQMLKALKQIIDKRKEQLSAEKDLYDFQKKVKNASQNVSVLKKQLAVLSGDETEENRARIQKLQVQLKEAEENLEETEYERWLSDTNTLMDNMYSEFEDMYDEMGRDINGLFATGVKALNDNSSTIVKTITDTLTYVGGSNSSLSEDMKSILTSNNNLIAEFGEKGYLHTNLGTIANAVTKFHSDVENLVSTRVNELGAKINAENGYSTGTGKITTQETDKVVLDSRVGEKIDNTGNWTSIPQSQVSVSSGTLNTLKVGNTKDKDKDKQTSNSSWFKKIFGVIPKNKTANKAPNTGLNDRLAYWGASTAFDKRAKYYKALGKSDKYTGSATQNSYILQQMKKKGYSSGGSVGDLIKASGEDGIAFVRKGEYILTPEMLKDALAIVNPLAELYNAKPNVNPVSSNISIGDTTVNLTLPSVKNYDEFKTALIADKQFEKVIQQATIGNAIGGNSLKKYSIR